MQRLQHCTATTCKAYPKVNLSYNVAYIPASAVCVSVGVCECVFLCVCQSVCGVYTRRLGIGSCARGELTTERYCGHGSARQSLLAREGVDTVSWWCLMDLPLCNILLSYSLDGRKNIVLVRGDG